METIQKGYRLTHFKDSQLTENWRAFFASQTLQEESSDQKDTFFVTVDQPTNLAPTNNRLCLELMTWSYLVRKDCDIVMWPLQFSLQPGQPNSTHQIDASERIAIKASGYIALSADPKKLAQLTDDSVTNLSIFAFTNALIESEFPDIKNYQVTFTIAKLKKRLKNRLTLEQKIWIKHKWHLLKDLLGLGQTKETIEHSLARKKTWEHFFIQPNLKLNLRPVGKRTPILIAIHWLELGGAEKFAIDLIKALPQHQYAIYVTTDVTSFNIWANELEELVEEIVHLPEFLEAPFYPMFYDYYIGSRQIQLMHIHHAPQAYHSLFHIRRFHPTLKILDSLHILELPPNSGGYPEFSAKEHEAFIDHHHVISKQVKTCLRQRWQIPDAKMTLAYLNVDSDYFNPDKVTAGQIRSQLKLSDAASLVGFIGRFADQKRPLDFIKAAEKLTAQWQQNQEQSPLHFVMVGSGLLEVEVKKAIKATQFDNIHLLGEMADTRPVYKDCDLLMMASINEGLALITFEAMAMQTPIFFTNVGAQSELLPPELLVSSNQDTVDNLVKAVWPYLLDQALRKQMGEQLRSYILKHHQHSTTFQEIMTLYERLLAY